MTSTRYGWHYIHVPVKMNDVGSLKLLKDPYTQNTMITQ